MFLDIIVDWSILEDSRQRLKNIFQTVWNILDKEFFDILYQSMPSMIEVCITANKWYTKY